MEQKLTEFEELLHTWDTITTGINALTVKKKAVKEAIDIVFKKHLDIQREAKPELDDRITYSCINLLQTFTIYRTKRTTTKMTEAGGELLRETQEADPTITMLQEKTTEYTTIREVTGPAMVS